MRACRQNSEGEAEPEGTRERASWRGIASAGFPTLRYETEGALAAADVGDLLPALGKGFERYARRTRVGAQVSLAVQRVEVGSLVAGLVVVGVGVAPGAAQHPEAVSGFIGLPSDLVTIAQGLDPGRNKQVDERLVRTPMKPVADGHAQQMNVFIVGDGNAVTIDREALALIGAARDEARAASAKHGRIVEAIDTAGRPTARACGAKAFNLWKANTAPPST